MPEAYNAALAILAGTGRGGGSGTPAHGRRPQPAYLAAARDAVERLASAPEESGDHRQS